MSEAKLTSLKKRRATIKGMITNFEKFVNLFTGTEVSVFQKAELQLRLAGIQPLRKEFHEVQNSIDDLVPESDITEQIDIRESFDNSFYSIVATVQCLLKPPKNEDVNDETNSSCKSHKLIKLPTIALPSFDGSYDNWLEFRDTFLSMIHKSNELDNIQKYHYLRSALTGNALQVIKSVEFSSDNYTVAWELIENRYNNTKLLINNHIKALFSLPTVNKETPGQIRKLIDTILKNLRALKTLGEPTESWDALLSYLIVSKLDSCIEKDWEQFKSTIDKDLNKKFNLKSLLDFLKDKADTLEIIKSNHSSQTSYSQPSANQFNNKQIKKAQHVHSLVSAQTNKSKYRKYTRTCLMCNGDHSLYTCGQFLNLLTADKLRFVEDKSLCTNCLRAGHSLKDCLFGPCRQCSKKHNSLLHDELGREGTVAAVVQAHHSSHEQSQPQPQSIPTTSINTSTALHTVTQAPIYSQYESASNTNELHTVLLSTAMIEITGDDDKYYKVRALLDSGSQHCIITESLSTKLNAKYLQSTYRVTGVGHLVTHTSRSCEVQIRSLNGGYNTRLKCLVLPKITTNTIPTVNIGYHSLDVPKHIDLADPTFYSPSQIDLLIGADYFWDLLIDGKIRLPIGPYLQNTKLGWVISGPIYNKRNENLRINQVQCHFVQTVQLNDQLKKFWEIEEIPKSNGRHFSLEEGSCEQLFSETTERLDNGRFSVRIPLKESANTLGDSYDIAKSRFISLERRLDRQPQYKQMYNDFIQEYISLGHMTRIEHYTSPNYFLPHHGVFREHSLTTKLRVVFNASQKTTSGKSLNDIQMTGPALQNDLFSILLRFRQHKYVACADIEKMFRQIEIQPDQRNLQLILWREKCSDPISVYRLNTVTYGTASAPYLSIRCVRQLGLECKDEEISRTILEDMYVDDLLTGNNNKQKLTDICKKVTQVCMSGCLPLRKWIFNSPEISSHLVQTSDNPSKYLSLDENYSSKTLGLGWYKDSDQFHFTSKINHDTSKITKRFILSVVSQIYDPLGLLSPIIIVAKVFLQRLWLSKVDWDDILPNDLILSWERFVHSLTNLNNIQVPRHVLGNECTHTELHVYTDASQTAYGACAYIRNIDNAGNVTVRLLCSKGRVAPIKPVSVPRLELCGALIGAKLKVAVLNSVRLTFDSITFWTDSTIVLGWLRMPPNQLKTFVQNRVVEINELTSDATWMHVSGKINPADLLSRGTTLDQLIDLPLWWTGPPYLHEQVVERIIHNPLQSQDLPEVKSKTISVVKCVVERECIFDFNRFSSYIRLQRACAYMFRFIHNSRAKNNADRCTGTLTAIELNNAILFQTKRSQMQSFPDEYHALINKLPISFKSRNISSLNIFLDKNNVIRVGGRLKNSDFTYDKKHPMLLCSKDPFTVLLFRYQHNKIMHAGPQLLLSHIRETWWPLGGRQLARRIVNQCVKCNRMKAKTVEPIMGNLPAERLEAGFPFLYCGVDYAGPMYILNRKGRGAKLEKCYLCLFVCFATKALHLELVTSLTSEGYILALKRFISRREKPSKIISDHGRNFVGAVKEFTNFLNDSSRDINDFAANNQIEFKFIPPYAPHFGGLWEAGVKSCKHHISRVIGKANLTYEEFSTVLVQIEAVLNSRPMYPLSPDPNDLSPLTPAHFMIGRSLIAPADDDVTATATHLLSRYRRVEQLRQHFWKRWSTEYISELQRRTKWKENHDSLEPNTLVLIKEDNLPPLQWRLGRILRVFPGGDGVARVAIIRTMTGDIQRAFSKICPLPSDDEKTAVESSQVPTLKAPE